MLCLLAVCFFLGERSKGISKINESQVTFQMVKVEQFFNNNVTVVEFGKLTHAGEACFLSPSNSSISTPEKLAFLCGDHTCHACRFKGSHSPNHP